MIYLSNQSRRDFSLESTQFGKIQNLTQEFFKNFSYFCKASTLSNNPA
ncbi:hypothetical protein LEP1GSC185_0151 [Leptospira licerasiae serovar Varillal str. VAR 010]|uniref:Uncharacterized protein n=1 Tax=Leptospira licerasiae str. MMD4847 TaxID=1049971 RepID=A0ABN0H3Y7_9LEPT|nr:hypothetical protein LEP1GSC185_0151 [Leptospira licerasiae serovar Varillal str. VAR 010]EJZ40249.1 hypothetical protein LEP1GSC178_1994 [Leptospira licerasiae str. MMD4847]